MNTNAIASPTNSQAVQNEKNTKIDYDSFLQLLVTQMQNQDPTNPTDSTEYLSQLAAFSNVEQAIQTNTKLDALMTNSNLQIGASLIGKHVFVVGSGAEGAVKAVYLDNGDLFVELDNGNVVPLDSQMIIS